MTIYEVKTQYGNNHPVSHGFFRTRFMATQAARRIELTVVGSMTFLLQHEVNNG